MEDLSLIDRLISRLQMPLPGPAAQFLMAPDSRRPPGFYVNQSGKPRLSSVMILLFQDSGRWKFPLIQRARDKGVHSGQMALPGGRMEPGDTDRMYTAVRETHEEIGIEMGEVRILGTLTELDVQASQNLVLPVIGYYPFTPVYQPDPVEVDGVFDAELDEIISEKNKSVTQISVTEKIHIHAPYYNVHQKVVWGATAMILSEFLSIIGEIYSSERPMPHDQD